jgi:hypothetical protein
MSIKLGKSRKMTTIPVAPCSVMWGATLVPNTADYYFFHADK